MHTIIKRATLDDLKRVAPLFDLYRQFYNQPVDVEGAFNFLKERVQYNQSVIFITLIDDVAVGFVQLYPIFSSVSLKKAWLLNDLYVDESSRKKGVAVALLDAAKELGQQTNSGWLLLQTSAQNTAAQQLYERYGWVREQDYFYTLSLKAEDSDTSISE